MRIPIAGEGWPFILASSFVSGIVLLSGPGWLFLSFLLVTVFIVSFFRDPEREVPPGADSIVSPADGRVIKVEPASEDTLLKGEATKISIFMNVFNVHVNRVPASGRVKAVAYHPGEFFSADLDKASEDNERNAILIENPEGKRLVAVQIAGLIARRIVCYLKEGVDVEKGKRFGMIRFGSRLDVYLPPEARVEVRVGDRVKAGSSILGYW